MNIVFSRCKCDHNVNENQNQITFLFYAQPCSYTVSAYPPKNYSTGTVVAVPGGITYRANKYTSAVFFILNSVNDNSSGREILSTAMVSLVSECYGVIGSVGLFTCSFVHVCWMSTENNNNFQLAINANHKISVCPCTLRLN